MTHKRPLPIRILKALWRYGPVKVILIGIFIIVLSFFTTGALWLTIMLIAVIMIFPRLPLYWRQPRRMKISLAMTMYGFLAFLGTASAAAGLPGFFSTISLPPYERAPPFLDEDGTIYVYSNFFNRVSKYDSDGTFLYATSSAFSGGGRAKNILFPEADVLVICVPRQSRRVILDRNLDYVGRDTRLCDPLETANKDQISDPMFLVDVISPGPMRIARAWTKVQPIESMGGILPAMIKILLFPLPLFSFLVGIVGAILSLIFSEESE